MVLDPYAMKWEVTNSWFLSEKYGLPDVETFVNSHVHAFSMIFSNRQNCIFTQITIKYAILGRCCWFLSPADAFFSEFWNTVFGCCRLVSVTCTCFLHRVLGRSLSLCLLETVSSQSLYIVFWVLCRCLLLRVTCTRVFLTALRSERRALFIVHAVYKNSVSEDLVYSTLKCLNASRSKRRALGVGHAPLIRQRLLSRIDRTCNAH